MELQEAIRNRRSIKKFDHDMVIDDDALREAVSRATDAPNHGLREPWRLVHIRKSRLGGMSRALTRHAFNDCPDKRENHFEVVTKLGGMLVLIAKHDPRQKQDMENMMAVGAYAQNLMLLLHEAGIGTCWKTPRYMYEPYTRALFNVAPDESIVGLFYLTDLETEMKHIPRKNIVPMSEF